MIIAGGYHFGKEKYSNGYILSKSYRLRFRNRNAFAITETELKLIAKAAIMGESSIPKNGYRMPAAIGTPNTL